MTREVEVKVVGEGKEKTLFFVSGFTLADLLAVVRERFPRTPHKKIFIGAVDEDTVGVSRDEKSH